MNLTEQACDSLLSGIPMPTSFWVQLHVGDPGGEGTDNVADESTRSMADIGAPSAGLASNENAVLWANAPSNESISHISLWDDDTAGMAWWVGTVTSGPIVVEATNSIIIQIGQLTLSLDYWT